MLLLEECAHANIVDTWKRDHVNFSQLLDLLEAQIGLFHEDQTPNYELMLDILYYMTHYPDIFHHPKEDLTAARARDLDAGAATAVHELMRQHAVLRESGAKLLKQLQGIVDGAMLKRESAEQAARAYIAYFRSHMRQEELKIFPLAQKLLSKRDWAAIEKAAPFREDPLFGEGALEKRYERLHRQIVQEAELADAT
ncbi:MAG TPA: hemerythrin domain-containing protein [Burkholderiaceae bacterium]|nr:hemerythrin domain-containing protein [Burkholderiaceae bacterium]